MDVDLALSIGGVALDRAAAALRRLEPGAHAFYLYDLAAQFHQLWTQGKDEARVVGRVLYIHTPDGFGPSKFASKALQKVNGTARNWATVTKLLELLDS